ncbi:hypothetical protein LV564_14255 [Komagataeibacter nataicola]|uniref:hypothetical protein n=1 Tax=Komagataeibacter nataicola TaxID=265960 RepID=UPI0023DD5F46|nr:hypothetical protein [Komagataeibacter nataicola]WEQ55247.1 hypothetical protein LV564_14255 [Komagataeibacter nataicola]
MSAVSFCALFHVNAYGPRRMRRTSTATSQTLFPGTCQEYRLPHTATGNQKQLQQTRPGRQRATNRINVPYGAKTDATQDTMKLNHPIGAALLLAVTGWASLARTAIAGDLQTYIQVTVTSPYGPAFNRKIANAINKVTYYPLESSRHGEQGIASVHVVVRNSDGVVTSHRLTRATGFYYLDVQSCLAASRYIHLPTNPRLTTDYYTADVDFHYLMARTP